MMKKLLLLADVNRLLKVGSLHSQNMKCKGWGDFVACLWATFCGSFLQTVLCIIRIY